MHISETLVQNIFLLLSIKLFLFLISGTPNYYVTNGTRKHKMMKAGKIRGDI